MPSINSLKASIGKQSSPSTPVAPTAVLPIKGMPGLDRSIEKASDPVIVGAGMSSGEFAVAASVGGPLSLSPRACHGFGQILKGAFGSEDTPPAVAAVIRIKYTGSGASCKLTADNSAKTISSAVGALGSEAPDSAFGSAGTISLSGTGYDTVAELVAAIEALGDYSAAILSGAGATSITSVMAGTYQAKGKWAVLILTGTGTGAYAHRFTPDLVIGSERPVFTVQLDDGIDNRRFGDLAVNNLSFSAALKGLVECDVDLLGFSELDGQDAMSSLELGTEKAFIFGSGLTSIGGVDYDYVRSASAKAANALKEDGYGQASIDRAYHAKGLFSFEGDIKLRYDATSNLERAKVASGVDAPILLVYLASEGKKVGSSSIAEMLIIEVPYAQLANFTFEENGGVKDASATWKARKPGGAYEPPVTIIMISATSAVY